MQISRRIQPNCSEWNEDVEADEQEQVPSDWELDIHEAIRKAKEIKEWD